MTDAKYLTHELRGHWFGHYGLAYCPAHENTNTPALSITNSGDGTLLARCHAGCAFTDVLAALRDRGLLAGGNGPSASRHWMPTYRGAPSADQRAKGANNAKFAAALWQDAQPICDSDAERYLRGRAITCPLPPTLRFAPACKHPTGSRMPAMIARVDDAVSFAVHRTFLADQGTGKTVLQPAKAMLGGCKGGAVHLSPIAIFEAGGPLVVTEGIENGLSLLSGLLEEQATVWAALSTSGLISLNLPRKPGRLVIAADGDEAGQSAARKLSLRAAALGWRVYLKTPPDGTDWNACLVMSCKGGKK